MKNNKKTDIKVYYSKNKRFKNDFNASKNKSFIYMQKTRKKMCILFLFKV